MSLPETYFHRSKVVKDLALQAGFLACGIAQADFLQEEAPRLSDWLKRGLHGEMGYMERNFDKRLDPRKLVPGTQTVVSLLYNYFPETRRQQPQGAPKISRYAWGKDYHHVLKPKLKSLLQEISSQLGPVEGRVFVDSAPVMDKVWAKKAGLGWIGKHSNLISPKLGSWFFIAELLIDMPMAPDVEVPDYCGTCTRCIDACPTDAIHKPYEVDGSKCISYFTIELKSAIPEGMKGTFNDWMFGCDICQEVCPWNRFAKPHSEALFEPDPRLLEMKREDWMDLTEDLFKDLFKGSAVQRTGYEGLKRNLKFLE